MSIAFPKMDKEEFRKLLDDAGVSYTEVAEGEGGIFVREEMERDSNHYSRVRKAHLVAAARRATARRSRRKTALVSVVMHMKNPSQQKNVLQRRQGK